MVLSEMFEIDIILIVILIGLFIYYNGTNKFDHFKNRGIEYITPIPYFGNSIWSSLNFRHVMFCHKEVYEKAKGKRFIGFFQNQTPFLIIRDPQLIQHICVKDFSHFYDRGRNINEKLDPLLAFNLSNLNGHKWKSLRQKLMPAFTSGKLKMMIPQFNECGSELIKYIVESSANNKPVNAGEAMRRYTTDVIGTCTFGLQFNALRDPNSEFRKAGREMTALSFRRKIITLLSAIHENLPALLNIGTFNKKYNDFFINLIKDTIKHREENNIERSDFIQILMHLAKQDSVAYENNDSDLTSKTSDEGKQGEPIMLNDVVMAANTYVFFVAGFETTASTLRNCLMELSLSQNLKIQNRLRSEILATLKNHDNKVTYETVKDMMYMDCVISETLRKYPVANTLVRVCTKPYSIPGTTVILNEGDKVIMSAQSIHHDPEYYPEPDLFDPERFNEENKQTRPNFTYLAFGDGPRACIGPRFALLDIKCVLSKILTHYEVTFNNRTQLPLTWVPGKILSAPEQDIFLNFKLIK